MTSRDLPTEVLARTAIVHVRQSTGLQVHSVCVVGLEQHRNPRVLGAAGEHESDLRSAVLIVTDVPVADGELR
jgi:hypothetical protein